jgi:hypothetical protein
LIAISTIRSPHSPARREPRAVPSGSGYSVTTETPPAGETCVVTNGSGTVGNANVTNITVTCGYTLGGPITGLVNNGLVLINNGTDKVSPAGGATSFTFPQPVAPDSPFSVTIGAQPSGQLCGVAGGLGPYLMPEQNDNNRLTSASATKDAVARTGCGHPYLKITLPFSRMRQEPMLSPGAQQRRARFLPRQHRPLLRWRQSRSPERNTACCAGCRTSRRRTT